MARRNDDMTDKASGYQQHGDVLIFSISEIPVGVKKVVPKGGRHILAEGETTGHAHAICDLANCEVYSAEDGTLYMSVKAPVDLIHEEHHAQTIQPGKYKIGRVREVDPFQEAVRNVAD